MRRSLLLLYPIHCILQYILYIIKEKKKKKDEVSITMISHTLYIIVHVVYYICITHDTFYIIHEILPKHCMPPWHAAAGGGHGSTANTHFFIFLLIIKKSCSCWWRTWKHGCILYALHLWRDSPRHLCHTQYTIYHTSYMTYNAAAGGGDSSTANTHFYFSFFDNKKNCSCWWRTWKHG